MKPLQRVRDWLRNQNSHGADPAVDALQCFEQGTAAAEAGDYRKAIKLFSQALERAPNVPAAIYHHRGAALAEVGKFRDAIRDYDQAIRLEPKYPDAYLDRGNAHHALDERRDALRDYSEAIRLKPDFAEAYANKAVVHLEEGEDDAAQDNEERARALGIDSEALSRLMDAAREVRSR